ncbi:hypothetical protein V6N12_076200 [Hibiscus sabdariffa]|uniref:Uncharacterized protein n=1 Tax=Hibiscus sabdariffa TaxID=183260 RepID=A0ABR2ANK4_9ROSI
MDNFRNTISLYRLSHTTAGLLLMTFSSCIIMHMSENRFLDFLLFLDLLNLLNRDSCIAPRFPVGITKGSGSYCGIRLEVGFILD